MLKNTYFFENYCCFVCSNFLWLSRAGLKKTNWLFCNFLIKLNQSSWVLLKKSVNNAKKKLKIFHQEIYNRGFFLFPQHLHTLIEQHSISTQLAISYHGHWIYWRQQNSCFQTKVLQFLQKNTSLKIIAMIGWNESFSSKI